jgi:hypothetical protein
MTLKRLAPGAIAGRIPAAAYQDGTERTMLMEREMTGQQRDTGSTLALVGILTFDPAPPHAMVVAFFAT